jgi:uncharacterized protein (TIRG00374 family)
MRLVAGALVGLGCLFLVSRLDLQAVVDAFSQARLELLALALALNLLYIIGRGLRWRLLIRSVDHPLPLTQALRTSSIGIVMSSVYPGFGEAARLVLLRRLALPLPRAAAVVVEERLIDTLALGLLLVGGVLLAPLPSLRATLTFPGAMVGLGVCALIGVAVLIVAALTSERLGPAIVARAPLLAPPRRLTGDIIHGFRASAGALCRSPGLALGVAALTIAAHGLAIAVGYATVAAFGLAVSPAVVALMVVALTLGIGLLPSPLGIGLYQAAGLALLGAATGNPEGGVAAATALQAINYGAAILAALAFMLPERRPVERVPVTAGDCRVASAPRRD